MESTDHRRQFWITIHKKMLELELDSELEQQIKSKLEETVALD